MTDFAAQDMPGWKTPLMGQAQDAYGFRSKDKIVRNIEHLKERLLHTDSLLDVGCFLGYLYGELGHKDYTGVDIFPENIERARGLYPEVNFFCSDLYDISGQWDVVWCSRVLIHNPDYVKAVRKLRTLAKRLLMVVISLNRNDRLDIEERADGKVYFRSFSEETIRSAGECEIVLGKKYTTVIYGPLLP